VTKWCVLLNMRVWCLKIQLRAWLWFELIKTEVICYSKIKYHNNNSFLMDTL
jgi:hypothetical protein